MTSRRIEGHKDYYDVLRKHQRTSRMKRLIKLVVLLMFFLALIIFSYIFFTKVDQKDNHAPAQQEQSATKTSRPGALII